MAARTADQPSNYHYRLSRLSILGIILAIAVAFLCVAIGRVRESRRRSESANNLRQLGISLAAMGNTGAGKLAPSYTFDAGTYQDHKGSLFYFLVPYLGCSHLGMPQDNLIIQDGYHVVDPGSDQAVALASRPMKNYQAPLDSSNPGTNGQISYWSNASALKPVGDGEGYGALLPKSFLPKGTAHVVILGERFSKTGDATFRWCDTVTSASESGIPANSIWARIQKSTKRSQPP